MYLKLKDTDKFKVNEDEKYVQYKEQAKEEWSDY